MIYEWNKPQCLMLELMMNTENTVACCLTQDTLPHIDMQMKYASGMYTDSSVFWPIEYRCRYCQAQRFFFIKDYIYFEIPWYFKFSKASPVQKYNWFTNIGLVPLSIVTSETSRCSMKAAGLREFKFYNHHKRI